MQSLIWICDYSEAHRIVRLIRDRGEGELNAYLEAHPQAYDYCLKHVRVIDASRAALDTFQVSDVQALSNAFAFIHSGEGRSLFLEELQALALGEMNFSVNGVIKTARGEALQVCKTWFPAAGKEEDYTRLFVVVEDIARQQSVEMELRRAKDDADAASRAKSEFLANMSHEIRTPLNAIIGMTGLMMDTPLSAEQKEYARTIQSSGDALLALINDILDFSKIEAGKLELEEQPFNLRECVEEALDLLAPRAADKNLDIAYLMEHGVPEMIKADVTRLRQILVNLISNAVKFTHKGEIVVRVTSSMLGQGRYEIRFDVKDTGIGIQEDKLDEIFNAFSQADASTTRRFGGTGLGLAICKYLVEMLGGRIWVESRGIPGEGATFSFTIQASAEQAEKKIFLSGTQPLLRGKRMLIVDDNATNRYILTRQAQSWRIDPLAVSSGEAALAELARGELYDLAILDMQMPEMDGLSLAQEIRSQEKYDGMPLVMLTSIGPQQGHNRRDLFAAFLTKPVKPSQLYDTLVGVFASNPQPAKASGQTGQLQHDLGKRHPLRILLAEDNVVNQKVALRMLERLGYRCDLSSNGQEAVEALLRQPYDLVLMDVQMPEMDGEEATRQIIKILPPNIRPRIVAMTANALSGDRERYLRAGMDDYVSKPVKIDELIRVLEESRRIHPLTGPLDASALERAAASNRKPSIDPAFLDQYRAMMGEDTAILLSELVEIFVENSSGLLVDMQRAIDSQDASTLHRVAHTMKGSSANLGARQLSELCKELEAMGRSATFDGAQAKLTEVLRQYDQVRFELLDLKEKIGAKPASS